MKEIIFIIAGFTLASSSIAAPIVWSQVGNSYVGSNGASYTNVNGDYYGSNGTAYSNLNGGYVGSNGTSVNRVNNDNAVINHSDGTTSSCSRLYNQWVCN